MQVTLNFIGGSEKTLELTPEELTLLRSAKQQNESAHTLVIDGAPLYLDTKNILFIQEVQPRPELVAQQEALEAQGADAGVTAEATDDGKKGKKADDGAKSN